ncbi:hypothetical protein Trydic_g5853 [Trypoxylus dichotomus]
MTANCCSAEHRAFAVEEQVTRRTFRIRSVLGRHNSVPYRKNIELLVLNFRTTSPAQEERQSPKRLALKHTATLGLSDRSVKRILHRDLHMHPYKIMVIEELSERHFESHKTMCEDILQNIASGAVSISSDDAHFHVSATANVQNFRYWAAENFQKLRNPRVTVWCAVAEEEEDELTVMVTSNHYCHARETFLQSKLNQFFFVDNGDREVWFQQDGATVQPSQGSLTMLKE